MVAAYSSAQCIIYDLETAAPVVSFDSAKTYSKLIVCFSFTLVLASLSLSVTLRDRERGARTGLDYPVFCARWVKALSIGSSTEIT